MPKLTKRKPKVRKHQTGQWVITINRCDCYLGQNKRTAEKRRDRIVEAWDATGRSRDFDPRNYKASSHTKAATSTPTPVAAGPISLSRALLTYLQHARVYYGDGINSEVRHFARVIKVARQKYGRESADQFDQLKFEAVRQQLIDEGLSRKVCNQLSCRLRHVFKWLAKKKIVPSSVYHDLRTVDPLKYGRTTAHETPPVQPVADDVIDATLPHLGRIVADMVRLHRLLGCRPGEICSMRPCEIDRSSEVWEYKPTNHKLKWRQIDRVIYVGPKAQAILSRYLDRDPSTYCFSPAESEAERRSSATAARRTPLSCGNRVGTNRKRRPRRNVGQVYTVSAYSKRIAKACIKAFPSPVDVAADTALLKAWQKSHSWCPNQIRHTAGTESRKRYGVEGAQLILGHAKCDTTQVYAERDKQRAIEIALEIG